MKKPRLLDLFCCAGGAGMGYARAGFEVVGVDIIPQPHYPFEFHQGDALEFLREHGHMFDAIHASPPCQAYSETRKIQSNDHPELIPPTRMALQQIGLPWVIENVPGSPLIDPVELCGAMFGLRTYRHRLFETSFPVTIPPHPKHGAPQAKMGRPPREGEFIHVVGNFSGVEYAKTAMGIDWMNRNEMAQAIPPTYTEYIGCKLMEAVKHEEIKVENQDNLNGVYCPLPLSVIPNHMGINLCSVESVAWTKQDDGQLVSLTINFNPEPKE